MPDAAVPVNASPDPSKRSRLEEAEGEVEEQDPETEENDLSEEEARIQEQYFVWRKNAPFLYDIVQRLTSTTVVLNADKKKRELDVPMSLPSLLSVQWLAPEADANASDCTMHKLLAGTYDEPGEKNYIAIYDAYLPNDAQAGGRLEKSSSRCMFQAATRIPHDGDVNRVRAQPGGGTIIASRMANGVVGVFDTGNFGLWGRDPNKERFKDQPCDPLVRGMGHSQEGYGLDWDPLNSGRLLTCGDDGKTLLWDVGAPSQKKEKEMSPTGSWSTAKVSDCQWSRKTGNLFGTSGLDGVVSLWDARHPDQALHFALEAVPQNALAFAPFNEHVLCSAGEGGIVYLWDLRAPAQPMHELKGHSEEVYQVQWSPTDDKMLASCGMDRQVIMWDLDRIGEEQSARDAKDGPPELLFIHSGHMATVMDIAWNPHQRFVMASVAEDASLHIWEPAAHVFSEPEQAESPQEDNVVVVE